MREGAAGLKHQQEGSGAKGWCSGTFLSFYLREPGSNRVLHGPGHVHWVYSPPYDPVGFPVPRRAEGFPFTGTST